MNDTSQSDQMIRDWLTTRDVLALLPAGVGMTTVIRWMNHGYRGVRLRATRFGGQWATKREWVDEFLAQIQEPPRRAVAKAPTVTERRNSHSEAERRLRSMGA